MPIKVTCPKCQGVLHAPDDAGGKRGKCPTCGTVLSIPADGPQVPVGAPPGEPAFRAPEPAAEGPGTHRSSFGAIPRPAEADVRRSPPPAAGTRLPPPPAFGPPEPRKLPDPFARTGRNPGIPGEGLIRAWRKTRRGLGWIRFGLFLFLLAVLGLAGIAIAENFGVNLPDQNPGYLQIEGMSAAREIKTAVVLVPVVLGLLACTLGRFGFSNAPRASFAKGLATAAAVASLIVLLALIALALPAAMQMAEGFVPVDLLPADDPNGIAQRVGLTLAVIFGVLGEIWFVSALGRMGAALHDVRLGARATRFLVLAGLIVAAIAAYQAAVHFYPEWVTQGEREFVQPYWDRLADQDTTDGKRDFDHRPTARWALIALAGLVVWFWYARLVGAGRRAIREWLEQNEPGR
jgi:hypothetical protein